MTTSLLPEHRRGSSSLKTACQGALLSASLILLPHLSAAADRTWVGTSDTLWSTGGNWSAAAPVITGGDGIIIGGSTGGTIENDLDGAIFNKLYFDAAAPEYTISGNQITINNYSNGIRNNGSSAQTLNVDIHFSEATRTAISANSGDLVFNGVLSGEAGISLSGSHTISLNAANTFGGGVSIAANRTLHLGHRNALGTGVFTISGGTLLMSSAVSSFQVNGLTGSGNAILNNVDGGGAFFEITGSGTHSKSAVFSGNGGLIISMNADGVQQLSGANTFTGGVTINSGRLDLASASGNLSASGAVTINGGSLSISRLGGGNKATTIASLNGTGGEIVANTTMAGGLAASGTLIVNTTTENHYAGSLKDELGTLLLTKRGTGSLTLSGSSSYTGATAVEGGSLGIEGTISQSNVTVSSGATLVGLGGEISSSLTLQNGSNLKFTLTDSGESLLTLGTLSLGTNVNLNLSIGALLTLGSELTLIESDNVISSTFATINGVAISDDHLFQLSFESQTYDFRLNYGPDAISLTVIPEPQSLLLTAIGSIGLARLMMRKRRIG